MVPAALTLLSLVWLTRYTLDATEVDLAADGVSGSGRANVEETA